MWTRAERVADVKPACVRIRGSAWQARRRMGQTHDERDSMTVWWTGVLSDRRVGGHPERACTSVRGSGAFWPGSLIRRVLPLWAVLNLES